jgi:WD40 repeat protein
MSLRLRATVRYGVCVLPAPASSAGAGDAGAGAGAESASAGPAPLHRVAAFGSNGTLQLWNLAAKELLCSFSFRTPITAVAASPDGESASPLSRDVSDVSDVSSLSAGSYLVVGLRSGAICVLDADNVRARTLLLFQSPVLICRSPW